MTVLCHPHPPARDLRRGRNAGRPGRRGLRRLPPGLGPPRMTDSAFAAVGVGRTLAPEVNDVRELLDLVDENLGIAVVPRHFRHQHASLGAIALKVTGDAMYETVAPLPPSRATSPAARPLFLRRHPLARRRRQHRPPPPPGSDRPVLPAMATPTGSVHPVHQPRHREGSIRGHPPHARLQHLPTVHGHGRRHAPQTPPRQPQRAGHVARPGAAVYASSSRSSRHCPRVICRAAPAVTHHPAHQSTGGSQS